MTSIDRSVILNRILPFIVLKVWFFSTTTGKDFCDCIISSMKGAIRRCCNEGCKILTAAGMHEALKVRQVKGSSAAVCEIDSGKKETKTKRINNFSFFLNFVYGKNGLHLSKFNLWNKLPKDIKSVDSFHTFKRRLLDFYDEKIVSYNLPSREGVS